MEEPSKDNDAQLKQAELELKRTEIETKRLELKIKRKEWQDKISEPKLTRFLSRYTFLSTGAAAILGLVLTGLGYMIQSVLNRQQEREKTQGQLILKAIEAKPDDAIINLKFLVDTGLLDDSSGKIREAVRKAEELKQIPSLPSSNSSLGNQQYTSKSLDGLQPNVAALAQRLIELAGEQNIKVIVIKAYVDPEWQKKLYEDYIAGKGNLVARPPTAHTEGRAVDLEIIEDENPSNDYEKYKQLAEIAKKLGFKWGGEDGKTGDKWHFEYEQKE